VKLTVQRPSEIVLDRTVRKVVAEAPNGWFGLLPRHADFVTALVPSVLIFVDGDGQEGFLGIDEGILVKCGADVQVSTRNAVRGEDLRSLRRLVRTQFLALDEREQSARSALARLEAGVVRRFIELQEKAR
jgi:F-type H+-transporting ATPase subunit epsilon